MSALQLLLLITPLTLMVWCLYDYVRMCRRWRSLDARLALRTAIVLLVAGQTEEGVKRIDEVIRELER